MFSAEVSRELSEARREYAAAESQLGIALARLNAAERAAHREFEALMRAVCHCGRGGHALNSVNCPVHGYRIAPKSVVRWSADLQPDRW